MLKTRRCLAVVTVLAGATLGGLAAWAAPLGSLGALPQGASMVTPVGYTNCWWKYGCKYCRYCYYYGGCHTVKKYCKRSGYYY
jgi:hypothetical protein